MSLVKTIASQQYICVYIIENLTAYDKKKLKAKTNY